VAIRRTEARPDRDALRRRPCFPGGAGVGRRSRGEVETGEIRQRHGVRYSWSAIQVPVQPSVADPHLPEPRLPCTTPAASTTSRPWTKRTAAWPASLTCPVAVVLIWPE